MPDWVPVRCHYRMDAVVDNPPFSYRWEPCEPMGEARQQCHCSGDD